MRHSGASRKKPVPPIFSLKRMNGKLKALVMWFLPVIVFLLYFVASRVVVRGIPSSFDTIAFAICALFVAFNPLIRGAKGIWSRVGLFILGFLFSYIFLFGLMFFLMAAIYHDSL
jgi:hypothetical protein